MGEGTWVAIVFIDAVRSVFVPSRNVFVPVVPVSFKAVISVNVNSTYASHSAMIEFWRPSSAQDRSVEMFITVLFMSIVRFVLMFPG